MKEVVKNFIKRILWAFQLDLTKNIQYDRYTRYILKKNLKNNYNCVDIGCHKGEILDLMLKYAPNGKHYAFEPIPYLFDVLNHKYGEKVEVFSYALSDVNEETSFHLVKNAPAYSGLERRRYDIKNPEIEEISVEVRILDEIISTREKIHFLKIDVEGGEFGVLKGAKNLLKSNMPTILFECGKGASDYYGNNPLDIYNFLTDIIGLKVFTLKSYIKQTQSLTPLEFKECFDTNKEYYFIASNV